MSREDDPVPMRGGPIFQYTNCGNELEVPHGEECTDQIVEHIEKHIGHVDSIIYELIADKVRINICHVKPTSDRPYHTLVTSGMSDLPMGLPMEYHSGHHMELMIRLPSEWQISQEAFENENWYWPVRQLKTLARIPHKYGSWFAWGHTIPNGDPSSPFSDNTRLSGMMIASSPTAPEGFHTLEISEEKEIDFFTLVPLYEEEMTLKLRDGAEEILGRFNQYSIGEVVDINRRNVAQAD